MTTATATTEQPEAEAAPEVATVDHAALDRKQAELDRQFRDRMHEQAVEVSRLALDHDVAKAKAGALKKQWEEACAELARMALDGPGLFDGPMVQTGDKLVPAETPAPDPELWRAVPLSELEPHGLPMKIVEKLADLVPPIATLGDLAAFVATPNKRLTDLDGIGAASAQKIEDASAAWYAANPDKYRPVKVEALLEWVAQSNGYEWCANSHIVGDENRTLIYTVEKSDEDPDAPFELYGDSEIVVESTTWPTLAEAQQGAENLERAHRAAAEKTEA